MRMETADQLVHTVTHDVHFHTSKGLASKQAHPIAGGLGVQLAVGCGDKADLLSDRKVSCREDLCRSDRDCLQQEGESRAHPQHPKERREPSATRTAPDQRHVVRQPVTSLAVLARACHGTALGGLANFNEQ